MILFCFFFFFLYSFDFFFFFNFVFFFVFLFSLFLYLFSFRFLSVFISFLLLLIQGFFILIFLMINAEKFFSLSVLLTGNQKACDIVIPKKITVDTRCSLKMWARLRIHYLCRGSSEVSFVEFGFLGKKKNLTLFENIYQSTVKRKFSFTLIFHEKVE